LLKKSFRNFSVKNSKKKLISLIGMAMVIMVLLTGTVNAGTIVTGWYPAGPYQTDAQDLIEAQNGKWYALIPINVRPGYPSGDSVELRVSTDNGQNWTVLASYPGGGFPGNRYGLYAASLGRIYLFSTDGSNLKEINPSDDSITTHAGIPGNVKGVAEKDGAVYIGTASNGVYRLNTGTNTFEPMNTGLGNLSVEALTNHNNVLYTVVNYGDVYKYNGAGWVLVDNSNLRANYSGYSSPYVFKIAKFTSDGTRLYALTMVYRTTDGQTAGEKVFSTSDDVNWSQNGTWFDVDPIDIEAYQDKVYAVDSSGRLQINWGVVETTIKTYSKLIRMEAASVNNGKLWGLTKYGPVLELDTARTLYNIKGGTASSVREYIYSNGEMFLITSSDVWARNASGKWEPRSKGLPTVVTSITSDGASLYLLAEDTGTKKVYKSTDGGENWAFLSSVGSGASKLKIFDGKVYLGVNDLSGAKLYSSNDGITWSDTGFAPGSSAVLDLEVDTTNNRLYIVTGRVWEYNGITFTDVSYGRSNVKEISVSPGGTQFLIDDGCVYKRADNTVTNWTKITNLPTAYNRVLAVNNLLVYIAADPIASGYSGIYKSTDGGTTFAKDNVNGVSEPYEIYTLYYVESDGTIWAGSNKGSLDPEVTVDNNPPVITPSVPGGAYNTVQTVTLTASDATLPVTIYYTLDGSEPDTSSPVYENPIPVNSDTTLKFFGVDGALNQSEVQTHNYIIDLPPVITGVEDGGVYNTPVTPEFNEGTATLNGEPFVSGTTVSDEGIYTLTVTDSFPNEVTVTFRIDKTPPVITVSPGGGTYTEEQWVDIITDEPATVYYSTNGIDPYPDGVWEGGQIYVGNSLTLRVKAIDQVGNMSEITVDYVIEIQAAALDGTDHFPVSDNSIIYYDDSQGKIFKYNTGDGTTDVLFTTDGSNRPWGIYAYGVYLTFYYNNNVYLINHLSGEILQITDAQPWESNYNTTTDGVYVAWGNYDGDTGMESIYLYNIGTTEVRQIYSTPSDLATPDMPIVNGDKVVWRQYNRPDDKYAVYGYSISSDTARVVWDPPGDVWFESLVFPGENEVYVFYEAPETGFNRQVGMVRWDTGELTRLTPGDFSKGTYWVYNGKIVYDIWNSEVGTNQIYILDNSEEVLLKNFAYEPKIYENLVVFRDTNDWKISYLLLAAPDTTPPVITIEPFDTTPTNSDVTVYASTNEGTLNAASHTFTENGSFDFIATDDAGNVSVVTVTVSHIDKTPPLVNGITEGGIYNTVTITFNEGVATLNGNPFNSGDTVSVEGSYILVVTDAASNTTTVHFSIDTTPPTVTATPPPQTFEFALDVTLASNEPNTTIYYTTDGSTPTFSSNVYSGPIHISKTTTVKAIGVDSSGNVSDVYSFNYNIIILHVLPDNNSGGSGSSGGGGGSGKAPQQDTVLVKLKKLLKILPDDAVKQTMSDMDDKHWASEPVMLVVAGELMKGTGSGFAPDRNITRAEFVQTLVNTVEITGAKPDETGYADADEIPQWAQNAVKTAKVIGLVSGYPDGTFRPNAPITRAEAAVLINNLIRLAKLEINESGETLLKDDLPAWAKNSIVALAKKDIVKGYPGCVFAPEKNITRAEVAAIIVKLLRIAEQA